MQTNNIILNSITGKKLLKSIPKDEEIKLFDASLLISETDLNGIITYANRRYCKLLGYTKEELIGVPQSIEYHPEMPVGLFDAIDRITNAKKIWRGYVKSICQNGQYFWSLLYVQAKVNEKDEVIGYTSTRKKAYSHAIPIADKAYKRLQGEKFIGDSYFMDCELYIGDELAKRA